MEYTDYTLGEDLHIDETTSTNSMNDMCEDGTACTNRNYSATENLTGLDVDLVDKCAYYMQGIALTPISVFGMLGKL